MGHQGKLTKVMEVILEGNTVTSVGPCTNQYLKTVHSFELDCYNDIIWFTDIISL